MSSGKKPVWWQRLLAAFASLCLTLLLVVCLIAIYDWRHDSYFHWFNGGEIQIVGTTLIVGAAVVILTFLLFVTPLVLIWPTASQLKHGHGLMGVSLLWPPIFDCILSPHENIAQRIRNWGHSPKPYMYMELAALFACGCYLLALNKLYKQQSQRP